MFIMVEYKLIKEVNSFKIIVIIPGCIIIIKLFVHQDINSDFLI